MKLSDYFALALRFLGAWLLYNSVRSLLLFLVLPRLYAPIEGNAFFRERGATYLLEFLLGGSVGLYFLRGAPHLVRFAYPGEQKDATNDTE